MITPFDTIIFTIIALSSMLGIYEGVVGLLLRLGGFIASIILSFFLYDYTIEFVGNYIHNEVVAIFLSGIISYIISLIICAFITHKLLDILSCIRGGFVDRFLGLLAGASRGIIVALILFFTITIFTTANIFREETLYDVLRNIDSNKYPEWLSDAETFVYLDTLNKLVIDSLPEEMLKSVKIFEQTESSEPEDQHSSRDTSHHGHVISNDLKQELDTIVNSDKAGTKRD